MSSSRCPYHVKQGIIDGDGNLKVSDICGMKSACGEVCPLAPFENSKFKTCSRYLLYTKGADRQVLMPRSDIEYLPDIDNQTNFGESEYL